MLLRLLLVAALASVTVSPSEAASPGAQQEAPASPRDPSPTTPPNPLPPPVTTSHVVEVGGKSLHFKATAGAIRLSDANSGAPIADIGYVAFQLEGAEAATRPLTFAVNGGPGASSAWLDLGALGPWRLPLKESLSPSAVPTLVPNAETWLDFTDLVFIDPPGTGYSRMIGKHDEAEKRFYSVEGDVEALTTVVRKWLTANDRLTSPKFIVGESYGGIRAPKLAQRLENIEGIGINGLVLVSPVIDLGWFGNDGNPSLYAAHLPSLVAAARGLKGRNGREELKDVEAYASGPYLVDLYKGLRDQAAIKRMSEAVAKFTGLDAHFVERLGGRVSATDLTRERLRDQGLKASPYDTNVTGYDTYPFDARLHGSDPILGALKAPVTTAMVNLTAKELKWPVNARYEILSGEVNHQWDWNGPRTKAESVSDLKTLLSNDPRLHILVAHGLTDQVTPYYTSKMLIDQIPAYGDPDRIRLVVYGGGHMLYMDDDSRAALRDDARKLIEAHPAAATSH